jgi:predicted  nucleic acid-binding Zn-ribbon protein
MNVGSALYHLQSLELEIIQKRKRINAIKREMSDNETVREAQQALENAQEKLKPLQTQQRDLELQIQANQEKKEQAEAKLYDGSVTKPKELQELQQEVDALTKWGAELDERTIKLMDELEQAQITYDDAKKNYEDTVQANTSENTNLTTEQETLQQEVDALLQKRREHLPNIDEDALADYNKLRKAKSNRPVSELKEESCSVCGVQQTNVIVKQVRQSDELIHCSHCKRILVTL